MHPKGLSAQIDNIQILRFIAAAMVLFGHLQHEALERPTINTSGFTPFEPVFWAGGVDIFFVISGFIIYYTASHSFGRPQAAKDFFLRRLIRIVPPYWLFTTLMITACLLFRDYVDHSELDPLHVLASYFFIPATNPYGQTLPVLILGWTLNFEMLFYAIFGLGLLLPWRSGMALILSLLTLLVVFSFFETGIPALDFWSDTIVINFAFGMAIAHARQKEWRLAATPTLLLMAAALGIMLFSTAIGWASYYTTGRIFWMGIPAAMICAAFALTTIQLQSNRLRNGLVFLGNASYAIYLSHPFTINLAVIGMKVLHITDPWVYISLGFTASVLGAAVFYKVAEKPLVEWLSAQLRARRKAEACACPS